MVGKIFIDYDEMEAKHDELRRYGEIVDDETPHYDGTFWHRKTMYLYDNKVWLVSMVGGGIEYLLDVTTLTRIEAKEED